MTSRRLSKAESRRRFGELRDLWCEWDPIGVVDDDCPRDEYDKYVGEAMRLLEREDSVEDVTSYLSYIIGEYIGLGKSGILHNNPRGFARKIQKWFDENWGDTYV